VFAPHFGAGMAIKSRVWAAPTWALLVGAFIPDFIWIVMARLGIESRPQAWHDDWSHSLLMVMVWATLFALLFKRRGRAVVIAIWLAVFSHFLLDLPIHPRDLALYPHSSIHIGWGLWRIGPVRYWYVQLYVLLALMVVYVIGARKNRVPILNIAGTCLLLLALHARNLLPF